jgi:hypothetical protein
MNRFPNKAGDHADTDQILQAELTAAGIPSLADHDGPLSPALVELLRRNSGEVKTSILGHLHGWRFERAWYYWMASGPGIPLDEAEALHSRYGHDLRVGGSAASPSPREQYKGLGCGIYHIDTPEALKALADCIEQIVADAQ